MVVALAAAYLMARSSAVLLTRAWLLIVKRMLVEMWRAGEWETAYLRDTAQLRQQLQSLKQRQQSSGHDWHAVLGGVDHAARAALHGEPVIKAFFGLPQ